MPGTGRASKLRTGWRQAAAVGGWRSAALEVGGQEGVLEN